MKYFVQIHDVTRGFPCPRSSCWLPPLSSELPVPGDHVLLLIAAGNPREYRLWEVATVAAVTECAYGCEVQLEHRRLPSQPVPLQGVPAGLIAGQRTDEGCVVLDDQALGREWSSLATPGRRRSPSGANTGTAGEVASPKSNQDIVRAIAAQALGRPGQAKFRKRLLRAYGGYCAATGCGIADALSAAHLLPHAEGGSLRVRNGLLLRADIHLLFDRHLLRLFPDPPAVVLTSRLRGTVYESLHHRRLRMPADAQDQPDPEGLRWRWEAVNACEEYEHVAPPTATTAPAGCDPPCPGPSDASIR